MDIHHAWCDWKPGVSDLAFSEGATKLSHLGAKEWMAGGSHVGSPQHQRADESPPSLLAILGNLVGCASETKITARRNRLATPRNWHRKRSARIASGKDSLTAARAYCLLTKSSRGPTTCEYC